MILLDQGYGIQPANWIVDEKKAPGYSRIYYLLSGEVTYKDQTTTKKLEIGKLYIFPSYNTFRITHNPHAPICCLWFHVDLLPTLVNNLIEIIVQSEDSLYYLLHAIRCEYCANLDLRPSFFALVDVLIKHFYEREYLPLPNESMSYILCYINDHYKQALTIEEIAHHFNYTPAYFIRMFKKEFHITPYQYLIKYRMNEAVRLLLSGMSISQIAEQVGYSDSKNFSYAFRLKFRVSPTAYKESYTPLA